MFHDQTQQAIGFYRQRGMLVSLNADAKPEQVHIRAHSTPTHSTPIYTYKQQAIGFYRQRGMLVSLTQVNFLIYTHFTLKHTHLHTHTYTHRQTYTHTSNNAKDDTSMYFVA